MCRTRSQTLRNLRQRVAALSSPHTRRERLTVRQNNGDAGSESAHRHCQSRCRSRARQGRGGGARHRQDNQRTAVRRSPAQPRNSGHSGARCHHPRRSPFPHRGVGRSDHIHPVSRTQQPDRGGIRDTHRSGHHRGGGPPLTLRRGGQRLGAATIRSTRTRSGKRCRRHGEPRRHRTSPPEHRPPQAMRPTAHPQRGERRHAEQLRRRGRRERRERRREGRREGRRESGERGREGRERRRGKRHDTHRLP